MKKIIYLVSCLFAGTVNATPFSFDYTFSDGSTLTGALDGTIQADSDTVFINSFGSVSYLGTTLASIELTDFVSGSDFPAGALQPLVSFSGNAMDIFVCPNGFTSGNCTLSSDGGFFFNNGRTGAGDGLGNTQFGSFNPTNWNLQSSTVSVPEPASLALLGLGLVGIGFSRKKKVA